MRSDRAVAAPAPRTCLGVAIHLRRGISGGGGFDGRHRIGGGGSCAHRVDRRDWVSCGDRGAARRGRLGAWNRIDGGRCGGLCRRNGGRRVGGGRLSGRRRRLGAWGQERQWVDVALRVRCRADAEIDVRLRQVRIVGVAGGPDDRPLVHAGPARHRDRAEMEQGHGRRGRRLDRDRPAAVRDRSRERHDALRGRAHGLSRRRRDVDPPVLPGRVRVLPVEAESPDHLAVHGPRPGTCGCREGERAQEQDAESPHSFLLRCQNCERPRR
jgi:hypothetical protein